MSNKSKPEVAIDKVNDAQKELALTLDDDIRFSLTVDPIGSLKFTKAQKKFLQAYIEFKNIPTAAQIAGIDEQEAMQYFFDPTCRAEIRRINLALYYRKFQKKLLTIDEVGGYLTSLLLDEDVVEAEKLKGKDKLDVVKLIIELNKLKADSFNNPRTIDNVDFEEIEELSPEDLKKIISETVKPSKQKQKENSEIDKKKDELIGKLNPDGLDVSEIAYLKTCTVEELENLVKETEKTE